VSRSVAAIREPFPPRPERVVGRARELATLRRLLARHPTRIALVGGGGSGKTTLAAELAHRVARRFAGGVHWLRVGAWDERVVAEMFALRLGLRGRRLGDVARALRRGGPRLFVLDNHENDRATAALLDAVGETAPVSFVITARRCLVAGVSVVPVVPPMVLDEHPPFPRVARLTRPLRSNPLGLEIADALVAARVATAGELERWLVDHGIRKVRALAHEDDVPEVALLVEYAWLLLDRAPRRALAVLAHTGGDNVDRESLCRLARTDASALEPLRAFRLVQEPVAGRFTLHATVRHALEPKTRFDPARFFEHYVGLLEREPSRLLLEEGHLFAAMDHAHDTGDLEKVLRVERLLTLIEKG
jgi:hypothetical protein